MNNFTLIDDFLPAGVFNLLREHCDGLDYSGVKNPVDGVVYPGISIDIPQVVLQWLGRPKTVFMRLSLPGMQAPHQAHTDTLMGSESLMLYLCRQEHCRGGTSLVRHVKTGMRSDPRSKIEEEVWKRDTNNPNAWEIYEIAQMQPNRAAIFDASLMHRAEPVGGFGTDAKNGRLVLTAFY